MLLITCSTVSFQTLIGDDNLAIEASITVYTDSDTYELRDVVVVMGDVATDGSPATDLLVSIEIKNRTSSLFYIEPYLLEPQAKPGCYKWWQ